MERDRTLHRLRLVGASLALLVVVLASVGLWLSLDNPAIDRTSRGDHYPCLAPWDTVLNDANNQPGGEPPPDADRIAERCRKAGEERFESAVGFVVAAAVVAVAAGMVAVIAYRRDRRPTTCSRP